ncbi:non-homologous end joining protein Ku [Goodfellowiella coeruleoviolacea]|uniref:Non-homologous end joining protein Ku n=1 Tax=Goodfellowiella coeruleoviolacea TaxID=334858 RepID=A0AAE3KEW8_9PSEU|nr:Ku protein [Goodfellowiella coeruleoviolacea]MCP2164270.1 DNA end-binding protein Ku [Goodfellowiella coeruleoviolacea]
MARAIWTGSISFGLVTIPVGLFSATEDHTVHFNQFQRGTSDRIRYKRVNERTGDEVAYQDIVKGHDVGGGQYVVVEPQELEDIAPGRSRSIDISVFVDLDEIDPVFFERTYWLAPAKPDYVRAYSLLAQAMEADNRVGIATFVMRGKEYLTALRADRGVLALQTMHFADEIRDPHEQLTNLPEDDAKARGRELDMATALVRSMSGPWHPEEFQDTYSERVAKLIEDKREGREVVAESGPPEPTEVTDLLEALRRSVERTREQHGGQRRGTERTGARTARRRSPESARRPAAGRKRGGEAGAVRDVAAMSKAELDRMARKLEIPGRSRMNRDELAAAVGQASASGRAS